MNVEDFRQMYLTELQEMRSVEEQLVQALPKMAGMANSPDLKQAFEEHLEETKSQLKRIQNGLRIHEVDPREHKDSSMQAIIAEAEKWAKMVEDPALRDAGLIASAQRVEHYEIAAYGTLATWAKRLGLDEDLQVLHEILEEEKRADDKLTELAKAGVNPQAAS